MQKFATELVALAPDVILAPGSSSTGPLLQGTRTIPIVFATIADPVAAVCTEKSDPAILVMKAAKDGA
jgi:putative ABC transport system substrate-binding protein